MLAFFFSRFFLVAALSCLLLTGCGTLSTYKVDPDHSEARRYAINPDLQFEVDSLASPLVANGETPGMAVGVLMANGESHFYSYGVADKATRSSVNADTLFYVGSLSKVFLGLMTAQLVDDGILSWDTTLAEALPPDVALSDDAKLITLQQLATHTSGLPRQPYNLKTFVYFFEYLFTGKNFYRHFDTKYVFDYLAEFKAPRETEPTYSNIGYGLLGYIVERYAKKSLESLFAEKVALPLNLQHTGYGLERLTAVNNRAHGYAGDQPRFVPRGQAVPDWELAELMKGSASMYSNARDLLVFAKAYMNAPSSMNTALDDTLRVRAPRAKEAPAIAWVADSIEDYQIHYQSGVIAGYTSFIGLDKRHNQAVVVLQNSFNWSGDIGYQLLVRLGNAQEMKEQAIAAVNRPQ